VNRHLFLSSSFFRPYGLKNLDPSASPQDGNIKKRLLPRMSINSVFARTFLDLEDQMVR